MNERDAMLFVVDDDDAMRRSLVYLFDSAGWRVASFESAHDFLARYDGHAPGCLVLDKLLLRLCALWAETEGAA